MVDFKVNERSFRNEEAEHEARHITQIKRGLDLERGGDGREKTSGLGVGEQIRPKDGVLTAEERQEVSTFLSGTGEQTVSSTPPPVF